jgi:predicted membrane channel-forming protein YqfA (hemolysin III family)
MMNKIIYQIGLLAFFVCVVLFGSQMSSLLDAIVRSFLVFVGVVFFALMLVGASALFSSNNQRSQRSETHSRRSEGRQPLTPASPQMKS